MAVRNLQFVLSGEDKSASKTIDKVHGKIAKLSAGLAGGALGAGVVEFGKKAVDAAIEGQQAQARLAQAVKNTGGSMDELEPKVAAMSGRFAKLGFTNDQVEAALAGMTTSLGSSEKAMGAMALAADLAKFKNVDLSTAGLAVSKAMEGNLKPLKQLGIDLPVAAGGAKAVAQAHANLATATQKLNTFLTIHKDAVNANSKQHGVYLQMVDKVHQAQSKLNATQGAASSITEALSHAVGGQASAAANTYAGKIAAMHAQFENFTEQVGTKLLPILLKLMNHLSSMAAFVERNQKVIKPLVAILAGFAGTIFLIEKAMKAWAVIQKVLDAELLANPIGLVVVAVALLVGGLILAYKHSKTFRDIVNGAFHVIAAGAKAMWDIIRPVLKMWADVWLTVVGVLVHSAAAAFGWVPGIGGKLKSAAKEFDKFKNAVNNSLDGITPVKTISIEVASAAANKLVRSGAVTPSEGRAIVSARTTHVTTNVNLDGKKIATVVTQHQTAASQHGRVMPGLA